ncbi:uncharacterized protein LOC142569781 [Dermacentor variabilis]|uniref:uncharacterized protein LOC142569781 n=1 Tax=Dermacentor variabilis TaxID=34621 RepID=UPI003F5B945C
MDNAAGGRLPEAERGGRLKLTSTTRNRWVRSRSTYEMSWRSSVPAGSQAQATPLRSWLVLEQHSTAATPSRRQGQSVSSAQAQTGRKSGRGLDHEGRGSSPRRGTICSHVDAEGFRIIHPSTRRRRQPTGRPFSWQREGNAPATAFPPGSSSSVNQPYLQGNTTAPGDSSCFESCSACARECR